MLTVPPGPLNLNTTQLLLRLQHIHGGCTTTHALTLTGTGNLIPDHDYNALEQMSQLSLILKKVYKESTFSPHRKWTTNSCTAFQEVAQS